MLHFSTLFDLKVWLFLDIIIPYVLLIKPSEILMMEINFCYEFFSDQIFCYFFKELKKSKYSDIIMIKLQLKKKQNKTKQNTHKNKQTKKTFNYCDFFSVTKF